MPKVKLVKFLIDRKRRKGRTHRITRDTMVENMREIIPNTSNSGEINWWEGAPKTRVIGSARQKNGARYERRNYNDN